MANWINKQIIQSGSGWAGIKSKQVEVDFWVITQETNQVIVSVSATDVTSSSIILVSPSWIVTTDHDTEDYQWDDVKAYATNIVNGVWFDVIAYTDNMSWGKYKFNCLYT